MTYRQIIKALTITIEAQKSGHEPQTCFTLTGTATALREKGHDHAAMFIEVGLLDAALTELAWILACEADHLDFVING